MNANDPCNKKERMMNQRNPLHIIARLFSMKSLAMLMAVMGLLILSTGISPAEEGKPVSPTSLTPGENMTQEFPKPGPEHVWLQQFVGEWVTDTEAVMEPGQPPVKSMGTETIRPLGGFWTVAEIKSTMMNKPFTGSFTLGFDSEKRKYVGTWVDSMTGQLWQYEGSLDPSGKILTLETEGTCPMRPGKLTQFKEMIEIKSPDHKVFTSSMRGDDGQWVTMMTSHSHRKGGSAGGAMDITEPDDDMPTE